jgi:hypothetical protein
VSWFSGKWRDSNDSNVDQYLTINLNGPYTIDSLIAQADDNDAYKLYYWNLGSSNWDLAWYVPAVGGWGLQTRPNASNDSEKYLLPAPIVTNKFKLEGGLPK